MAKKLLLTTALWVSAALSAATPANLSQEFSKGIDCELFLNPYVESALTGITGQMVLDAGCGLAPQTIVAAKNGAIVSAFETSTDLLEVAQSTLQTTGFQSHVAFILGSKDKLPYESASFDRAICINSAVDAPSTLHIISGNQNQEAGLGVQMREISRVMKVGGNLMVAAPASYGVVFSDGRTSDEAVYLHIQQVLAQIGPCAEPDFIAQKLSELQEVMRATFVFTSQGLSLVENEKSLRVGQQIWCKTPSGAFPCIYHSEEEFLMAINQAGLFCEEIKRPCFFGNVKRNMWLSKQSESGQSLGSAYTQHHPFTIYYVVKKAQ